MGRGMFVLVGIATALVVFQVYGCPNWNILCGVIGLICTPIFLPDPQPSIRASSAQKAGKSQERTSTARVSIASKDEEESEEDATGELAADTAVPNAAKREHKMPERLTSNASLAPGSPKKKKSSGTPGKGTPGKFVVEAVVGKQMMNGEAHYLIKWKNYASTQNTWEPFANIKEFGSLVKAYEAPPPAKTSTPATTPAKAATTPAATTPGKARGTKRSATPDEQTPAAESPEKKPKKTPAKSAAKTPARATRAAPAEPPATTASPIKKSPKPTRAVAAKGRASMAPKVATPEKEASPAATRNRRKSARG
mmetsp:Transcript_13972/g.32484  ORF Transcript_13972/g.32484 Transcript_13972/m.32484 type:complete len:310 (-) Transcript_13972:46-975(-)